MTRIKGPVQKVQIEWGWLRAPMFGMEEVGDRMVPPLIEADFPGVDGQPGLSMVIEVIDGVPRCTEVTLRRVDGGREIRPRDLRAIDLETWVESFVALFSGQITERDESGGVSAVFKTPTANMEEGIKAIRDVRKGSRRPLTDERKRKVADVYNAQESGGIEAVETAFTVSRSTAIRYIRAAREAGLIEARD